MLHSKLTQIHVLENWTYANAAARTGATGFVTADIGKIAFQTDTGEYWRLIATTPTWQPLGPGLVSAGAGAPGSLVGWDGTHFITLAPPLSPAGTRVKAASDYALLTAGAPADLGSLTLPTWYSRWTGASILIWTLAQSGTITAGLIGAWDAAGGGGNNICPAVAPRQNVNEQVGSSAANVNATYTGQTIYFRQTVNSAAAGTVRCYFVATVLY